MKLLALDQASRTTGYAVFEDNKLIAYGKFTYEDEDMGIRLFNIRSHIEKIISSYGIDMVILEDIQLQNNVSNNVHTFKVLAEVYGVVIELMSELKLPYHTVLAATWKSKLNIKGKTRPEQKKNAQFWVEQTYNVKPTQDESDAICIGSSYLIKEEVFDWSE